DGPSDVPQDPAGAGTAVEDAEGAPPRWKLVGPGLVLLLRARGVERRLGDVRGLLGARAGQGRGASRPQDRREVLPLLRAVADLPADAAAPARPAGAGDHRLRRPRRVLHAVPRDHAAGADELPAHAGEVAQRADPQHRPRRGDAAVRGARCEPADRGVLRLRPTGSSARLVGSPARRAGGSVAESWAGPSALRAEV